MNHNWNQGYRKAARFLLRHPLHPSQQNRAWTEWEAFNDILDQTAGVDQDIQVAGKTYALPRGTVYLTLRGLQRRWRWRSTDRVKKFIHDRIGEGSLVTLQKIPGRTAGIVYLVVVYDSKICRRRLPDPTQAELNLSGIDNEPDDRDLGLEGGHGPDRESDSESDSEAVGAQGDNSRERSANRTANRSLKGKKGPKKRERGRALDILDPESEDRFRLILENWNIKTRQDQLPTDDKRIRIATLLETFEVRHLCQAIDGALRDPWFTGKKDGQKRLIFDLVFHDVTRVEKLRSLVPAEIHTTPAPAPEPSPSETNGLGRKLVAINSQRMNHELTRDEFLAQAEPIIAQLQEAGELDDQQAEAILAG